MTRFISPLIAILLCGTALAGCASDDGLFGSHKKPVAASEAAVKPAETAGLPADLETGVRQAQEQRLAGKYDDAIHTLSQLMLVASDDPRVVGEYGKTLAEKGRAQEAVQFLNRATELQPNEWSFYSALGVSYDQLGDQASARIAYEHALKLKPNDASVLNNYALSRMMANDPDAARQLIARAEGAGGASDPKIARNIELVNKLAPAASSQQKAASADVAPNVPASLPKPVSSQALPAPSAQNMAVQHPASQVVMQSVPSDPQAGPAKPVTHAPTPLASHAVAKAGEPALRTEAKETHLADGKPGGEKTAMAVKADAATTAKTSTKPVKTPGAKADSKDVRAADAKPDAKSDTKAQAKPASNGGIPELRQTASAY